MGHQRTLYLKRADAVARRLDDIVLAADKPVIAVLVAPCHVAGVVDAVVPCLVCQFGVAVVLLEQPERAAVAGAHHDFPLFAVFCPAAVGGEQVYVVDRPFLAHGAGFRLKPRVGGYGECGFGLTEAFHQFDACQTQPFVVDARVECLAGDGAVFQR